MNESLAEPAEPADPDVSHLVIKLVTRERVKHLPHTLNMRPLLCDVVPLLISPEA